MRIPHTVNLVTHDLYKPSLESIYLKNEVDRKFRTEDYMWDNELHPTLAHLCLRILLKMFEKVQYLDYLPCKDVDFLFEHLPTTLPMELTIPLISDGIYWKRSYIDRWHDLNEMIRKDRINWKVAYIERHMQDFFENIEPEFYVDDDFKDFWILVQPYVKRIIIRQLIQEKLRAAEQSTRKLIHHIDFSLILKHLHNVTQLDLIFGPRSIKEKFKFKYFNLSVKDCKNLASGINCMPHMQIFRLHRSKVYDDHVQAIVQAFVSSNKTLLEMDFSHCKITNKGAYYFAELIRKHPTLETLKLCNNLITQKGILSITYVLQSPDTCPLKHLDLTLNPLGGEGFKTLFSSLIRNKLRPAELILADIGFTEHEAIIFGEGILPLNVSLEYLDISNNACGVDGGKAIAGGLENNFQILHLDYRACGFDGLTKFAIKKLLHRNNCLKNKRIYNEDDVEEEDDIEIKSLEEVSHIDDEEEEEEIEEENRDDDD